MVRRACATTTVLLPRGAGRAVSSDSGLPLPSSTHISSPSASIFTASGVPAGRSSASIVVIGMPDSAARMNQACGLRSGVRYSSTAKPAKFDTPALTMRDGVTSCSKFLLRTVCESWFGSNRAPHKYCWFAAWSAGCKRLCRPRQHCGALRRATASPSASLVRTRRPSRRRLKPRRIPAHPTAS